MTQSELAESGEQADSLSLKSLPLYWKFVFWQTLLLAFIVWMQNVAVGASLSLAMMVLWKRWSDWREAVVALFILACVLASSREAGLQYWKTLRLFYAGLVVLEAVRQFRKTPFSLRSGSIGLLLVVLLGTGIPAMLSEHVLEGVEETVLLSSMWWAMIVLGRVETMSDSRRRLLTLVHLGLMVVLVSIAGRFGTYELCHLNGRFRGIFGNPNEFSHWWLSLFVLGLVASKNLKNRRAIAIVAFTAVLFFWSGTRGALLAALLSLGGWWLQRKPSSMVGQMTKVFVVVGGLFLATVVSMESIVERLPEQMVREENLNEGGGRLLAWEHALDQIKMRPWFGWGGGAEERYFTENYSYFALQNHQGLSHNSWLAFAMNYGIPATIGLFLVLFSNLGLIRRPLFIVGLLPFVVSLTVEGWLTAPMSASSPMLFFIGGLLAAFTEQEG